MSKHVGGGLTWTQNCLNNLSLHTATLRFEQQIIILTTLPPGMTVVMNWAEVCSYRCSCLELNLAAFQSLTAKQSWETLCLWHLCQLQSRNPSSNRHPPPISSHRWCPGASSHSPVCIRMWRTSWLGFLKVFPQWWQLLVKPLRSIFFL